MKKILVWLYTGLMLGCIATANATVIVDTGPGAGSGSGGWSLYSDQWLGAQFSIGQTYTITNVEGWIGGGNPDETATVAIYSDKDSAPGTELFSASFFGGDPDAWYGASGLSWLLDAGTYWVAFEVRPQDTFDGWMENPVLSPLGNEAFTSDGNWVTTGGLDIGVRISSIQNVPEPATLALMGLGMAGLGFMRTKQAR